MDERLLSIPSPQTFINLAFSTIPMECFPETSVSQEACTEAQKWLEKVGETLRVLSVPYCSLGLAATEGLGMFKNRCFSHLNYLPANEKEGIVSYLQKLEKHKPSPDIFLEIKKKTAEKAIYEMCEIYADCRSAIVFGDPLGDVDIGIIIEKEDERRIRIDKNYTKSLDRLRRKYPVIDVFALDYFRSTSGKELAEKLFKAQCEAYDKRDRYKLKGGEIQHLMVSVENSWLLKGEESDYMEFLCGIKEILLEIRGYFEKIRTDSQTPFQSGILVA